MRRTLLTRRELPAEVLRELAADPDEGVRLLVAGRAGLPADLRERLAADPDENVRREVAG
ncbi:hypothetical protein ACXXDK_02580 [Deinococcus sp. PESE-38]